MKKNSNLHTPIPQQNQQGHQVHRPSNTQPQLTQRQYREYYLQQFEQQIGFLIKFSDEASEIEDIGKMDDSKLKTFQECMKTLQIIYERTYEDLDSIKQEQLNWLCGEMIDEQTQLKSSSSLQNQKNENNQHHQQ